MEEEKSPMTGMTQEEKDDQGNQESGDGGPHHIVNVIK